MRKGTVDGQKKLRSDSQVGGTSYYIGKVVLSISKKSVCCPRWVYPRVLKGEPQEGTGSPSSRLRGGGGVESAQAQNLNRREELVCRPGERRNEYQVDKRLGEGKFHYSLWKGHAGCGLESFRKGAG